MDHLKKQHESFCENAGLFGILISVACLIQHLYFMIPHWVTFAAIGVYVVCITGFIYLMLKSVTALPLLFTGAILIYLLEVFMILSLTFSLVVLIFLLYLAVIVILLLTGDIQQQLKKKELAEKEELDKWQGIV